MKESSLVKIFDGCGKLVGLKNTRQVATDPALTLFEVEILRIFNEHEQLQEEKEMLGWFIATLRDVFAYNEHDVIDLDLIHKCFAQVEDCDVFTKEDFSKIHESIIGSGLDTLPTTDKAIRELGE